MMKKLVRVLDGVSEHGLCDDAIRLATTDEADEEVINLEEQRDATQGGTDGVAERREEAVCGVVCHVANTQEHERIDEGSGEQSW